MSPNRFYWLMTGSACAVIALSGQLGPRGSDLLSNAIFTVLMFLIGLALAGWTSDRFRKVPITILVLATLDMLLAAIAAAMGSGVNHSLAAAGFSVHYRHPAAWVIDFFVCFTEAMALAVGLYLFLRAKSEEGRKGESTPTAG